MSSQMNQKVALNKKRLDKVLAEELERPWERKEFEGLELNEILDRLAGKYIQYCEENPFN